MSAHAVETAGTLYTPAQLTAEARAAVRGLGRFDGWALDVPIAGELRLRAYFIRHYNPLRPKHAQAREFVAIAI